VRLCKKQACLRLHAICTALQGQFTEPANATESTSTLQDRLQHIGPAFCVSSNPIPDRSVDTCNRNKLQHPVNGVEPSMNDQKSCQIAGRSSMPFEINETGKTRSYTVLPSTCSRLYLHTQPQLLFTTPALHNTRDTPQVYRTLALFTIYEHPRQTSSTQECVRTIHASHEHPCTHCKSAPAEGHSATPQFNKRTRARQDATSSRRIAAPQRHSIQAPTRFSSQR
jgi:hypothetical protein